MLATTSLGAVWSSCSPDFGAASVVDRFGQIAPKVLFAVDGYSYRGGEFDCTAKVAAIAERIDSIETVVAVPNLRAAPDLNAIPRARSYTQLVERPREPHFEPLPFDHPVYILFSSGTTGPPKCIVHGAGGTLLQHLKEHVLHADLNREDRIFYFTSCGWMMWNWLVSSLAVGATVVLYDGSPFHPAPDRLFDLADDEGISVFGTSAKYLSAIEKEGLEPVRTHDLRSMRTILSTGSPLAAGSFEYVYRAVKSDVLLASISGGTDIVSCFALGNPTAPVYRGELQSPGLGMRVDVFGQDGSALPPEEKGELVCTQAFPSMPVGFWNDPGGTRYRSAYFERFPGAWHHGDYCERTRNGGFRIWGRSDAVLNPGGVRIGTAEIYAAVESMPEVLEALAVGWRTGSDEEVVLFVRLASGTVLDTGLCESNPRTGATPGHAQAQALESVPGGRHSSHAQREDRGGIRPEPAERPARRESWSAGQSGVTARVQETWAAVVGDRMRVS